MKLTRQQRDQIKVILVDAGLYNSYGKLRDEIRNGLKAKFPEDKPVWSMCWGLAANDDPYRAVLQEAGMEEFILGPCDVPDSPSHFADSGFQLSTKPPSGPLVPCEETRKTIPIARTPVVPKVVEKDWEIEYDEEHGGTVPEIDQTPRETVNWLIANVRRKGVTRQQAPNSIAWTLLWHARHSREGLEKLVARFYATVSTKDSDSAAAFLDDGRKILGTVEECLRELKDAKDAPK